MVKLVLVRWTDAHVPPGTWAHIDELHDDGPYYVDTVGYLLTPKTGAKKGHTSICQSWGQDDYIDGILHIPTKMVQHQIVLYEEEMQVSPNDFKSAINYLSRVTPRGDDDQRQLLTLIDKLQTISQTLNKNEQTLQRLHHNH